MTISFNRIIKSITPLILISCSTNSIDPVILSELNSGIIESNKVIDATNKNTVESLRLKTYESHTRERANIWLPKAEKISELTKEQNSYLIHVKNDLKNGFPKGQDLIQKLSLYLENILAVDSNLRSRIGDEIQSIYQSSIGSGGKNIAEYISSNRKEDGEALITALQNSVLRIENKCLTFCIDQIGYLDGPSMFDSFEAILGQNAKILKVGDELEIMTGLGSFSRTKVPKIMIGNKPIQLNEKGFGIYKFKTSKQVGEYSIPVKIEFVDQDGRSQERTFNVEYTLVEAIKKQ